MLYSVSDTDQVIRTINDIASLGGEPEICAQRVQEFMARAVVNQSWVPDNLKECCNDEYKVRPLHVDPEGRFSICVMAWSPGQTTPIHDHIAWCVATVYQGTEIEETFKLASNDGTQLLELRETQELKAGDAVIHLPVDGDIHRVTCGPLSSAVSIHVYGCNVSVAGSSIRTTFDDMPVAN